MMGRLGEPSRPTIATLALYAVGVAGLAACLTLVFLGMRTVMNVGGFCAEGGPYVIETPCPEGVPLVMIGGIFGLFLFGGLLAWKGSVIGGPYAALVGLAWPALFLSLGWNFLEYAIWPPVGEGVVWGWLIPGVIFVLMGGGPLLAVLPLAGSGRATDARARLLSRIAERAATQASSAWTVHPSPQPATETDDLLTKLERLAALRQSGALSEAEFAAAKKALLDVDVST